MPAGAIGQVPGARPLRRCATIRPTRYHVGAEAIDSEAAVTLDKVGEAWTITAVHLTTRARVPKIDAAKFGEIAAGAKANCPLSRVINATITLDAKLVG